MSVKFGNRKYKIMKEETSYYGREAYQREQYKNPDDPNGYTGLYFLSYYTKQDHDKYLENVKKSKERKKEVLNQQAENLD